MKIGYLHIIIIIVLTCVPFYLFGDQDKNDTLMTENQDVEKEHFVRQLDSLLTLWYVKNSFTEENDSLSILPIDSIPEFSDSMIINNLRKLPIVVDMTYNDKVRSYIDFYTVKARKQVSLLLGLSDYYFPMFEEILDSYDIPIELKYLSIIESALNPKARSWAGATGIWQFMLNTGKMYKLDINSYVDQRCDPVASTHAAAKFLKDLYDMYHDWTLVIAAYNCGPGTVNRAIARAGGSKDFWKLYPYLPYETRGYVPAYIGATYAMEYHDIYNIRPKEVEFPIACDTVMINDDVHFKQIAEVLRIDLKLIQDLNPEYRRDIIPGRIKSYPLMIPVDFGTRFIELEDSIFNYKDSVYLYKSTGEIAQSGGGNYKNYTPDPPSENMTAVYYTIKSGDNLGFIASWFDVRIVDLKYWNNLYSNFIRAGQKLIVYVDKASVDKYSKVDQMSFNQKQRMIGAEVLAQNNTEKTHKVINDDKGKYLWYTVKSGDNFWSIAQKYDGVSNTDIMQINGISDPTSLKPGQKIRIKRIN